MEAVEEKYMERCIELARGGMGNTYPNPLVGAVIVCNGEIIGEGFHRRVGEAHAEVNAISSVRNKSLLRESTLYVNLEPCSHYGRTPPCAELIINKGIPRVVVGCLDPYPEVSGRGVRMLLKAGVEVVTGVLENEAYTLNKKFMVFHEKQRPYIMLKWAQTTDRFIDYRRTDYTEPALKLSSGETLRMVHKLRSEYAAIMVGTRTALLDNPSLSVRHWSGRSPVRIVLDRHLCIPSHYHLLDGTIPTIVFTARDAANRKNVEYICLDYTLPLLPQIMQILYKKNINSLLVEGGTQLLNSFLQEGFWDEAHVEVAPFLLKEGVYAPEMNLSIIPFVQAETELIENEKKQRIVLHYATN